MPYCNVFLLGLIGILFQASGQLDSHRASAEPGKVKANRRAIAESAYHREFERFIRTSLPNPYLAYVWSRRWMDVELESAVTAVERQAIAKAHLERIKDLESHLRKLAKTGEIYVSLQLAVAFYLAEAEFFFLDQRGTLKNGTARQSLLKEAATARAAYEIPMSRLSRADKSSRSVQPAPDIWNALDWSQLWFEAEKSLQAAQAGPLATAQAYLSRTKRLESIAESYSPRPDIPELAFYHADADFWTASFQSSNGADRIASAAKSRLAAVGAVYEHRWMEYLDGPGSHERLYWWSCTWRECATGLAKTEAEVRAANQAHVERMKRLKKLLEQKFGDNAGDLRDTLEFYCAQAESLLKR